LLFPGDRREWKPSRDVGTVPRDSQHPTMNRPIFIHFPDPYLEVCPKCMWAVVFDLRHNQVPRLFALPSRTHPANRVSDLITKKRTADQELVALHSFDELLVENTVHNIEFLGCRQECARFS